MHLGDARLLSEPPQHLLGALYMLEVLKVNQAELSGHVGSQDEGFRRGKLWSSLTYPTLTHPPSLAPRQGQSPIYTSVAMSKWPPTFLIFICK